MNAADLTIWIVLGAGFLSFISPCCLPLYPSYLSYITGVSVNDLKEGRGFFQKQALLHTVFFILDFSIIFIALGLSASFVGNLFSEYQELIRQLGGIMVALFGLVMLGVFTPKILLKSAQFEWKKKPV